MRTSTIVGTIALVSLVACGGGGSSAGAGAPASGGSAGGDDGAGGANELRTGGTGGTVADGGSGGGAEPTCDTGRSGPDCECDVGTLEDDTGACAPACEVVDCGAHGQCSALASGAAACDCDSGYEGELCDACAPGFAAEGDGCAIDPCATLDCVGHAHCEQTAQSVSCVCDDGYSGDECDTCAAGYSPSAADPSVCEFDACDGVDCGAGTCVAAEDGLTASCQCDPGYDGDACDTCVPGWTNHDGECLLQNPVGDGIITWLNADSIRSVDVDETGTVTSWQNTIAETPDSFDGIGRYAPTYVEISVGEVTRHVLRFDGLNDKLTGTVNLKDLAAYTIFVVANPSDTAGKQAVFWGTNAAEDGLGIRLESLSAATQYRFSHLTPVGSNTPSGAWYVSGGGWAEGMQIVRASLTPGGLILAGDADPKTVENAPDPFDDVMTIHLGGTGESDAPYFSGDIAEILVYDRFIDMAGEGAAIEAYLAAKWRG